MPGHRQDPALKRERHALAERLAMVEAYQPGIITKPQEWIVEVDAPPRRRSAACYSDQIRMSAS